MKKIVVLTILLAALVLSAVNPWPAQLRVWNYTGDNVYFRLSYRGVQQYFLTATVAGNTDTRYYSLFEVSRKKYNAEVTACSVTASGTVDLNTNLKLTFVDCDMMRQVAGSFYNTPDDWNNYWVTGYPYRPGAFWGEPGMEKPNFYQHWNTTKVLYEWRQPNGAWPGYWYEKTHKLGWEQWQFKYDLPADYEKNVTFYVFKNECPWPGPPWCGPVLP